MPTKTEKKPKRIRRAPAEARKEILDAAETLLANRPFAELRIDDLMAATGMTRPAFYHYFRNMEGVARALLDRVLEDILPVAQVWMDMPAKPPPIPQLRAAMQQGAESFSRNWVVLTAIHQASHQFEALKEYWDDTLLNPFIDIVAELLTDQQEEGAIQLTDPSEIARALLLMNMQVLLARAAKADPDPAEAIADTLSEIWIRTLYGVPANPSDS